ncbi:hypothetical protein EUTSA_v10015769mg [Eutrema salsugineum]|uniref:RNase H type-1 domain-containing protein n=1 Tax=Eutrema salsugineum TaxID=72664 RepID=V4LMK2_EUTSA|nr:hypothetical protein EUTSA_v10015769mg [Eutrema salsugineum]
MVNWIAGFPLYPLSDPQISLEDKIHFFLNLHRNSSITDNNRKLPFWILWRLWKARNNLLFDRNAISAEDTVKRAWEDTNEWLNSSTNPQCLPQRSQAIITSQRKWLKPARLWVKCNYDSSHHPGNPISGLGWIIHNCQGTFLECGMGKFQGRNTAEETDCTTLIWAMQSSWAMGFKKVEFEGDNLNINRLINSGSSNFRLQHYLEEIKQWRAKFQEVKFSFRHRETNSCAYILAKKAIIDSREWFIYHICPQFLYDAVNNDSSCLD